MNRSVTMLLTLAALSVALPAGLAAHCSSTTTSPARVDHDGYYVVADTCVPGCLFAIHIYEESNGIGGLQRADNIVDGTCHGRIPSDTRVL